MDGDDSSSNDNQAQLSIQTISEMTSGTFRYISYASTMIET